jgi:zinc/manganese transport system permease protein
MTLYDLLIAPFADPAMRRALAGATVLALGACPIGVFLMLRRMSLAGDAIAHGILPGTALAFLLFGLQVLPMTLGGIAAGLAVALLAGLVSRFTVQKEDSSFASFNLISLALGVLIMSLGGSDEELMHVLFGSILTLKDEALIAIGAIATLTLAGLAVIWRGLAAECLDPQFLRSVSRAGPWVHLAFLALAIVNLVGGFLALGTLLAVGLMMLPAAAARFWVNRLEPLAGLSVVIGVASALLGLLAAHHTDAEPGPAIILTAGAFYVASLLLAPRGLIFSRVTRHRHKTA